MKKLVKTAALLFLIELSAPLQVWASSLAPFDPYIGLWGTILVHESGHALFMALTGHEIQEFRPYPNMCGGKWTGGCVIGGSGRHHGLIPLSERHANTLIEVMGTGTSIVSSIFLIPMMKHAGDFDTFDILANMTHAQILDWPTYIVMDLLGFEGDWHNVSVGTGIPLWVFLPLSIGQAYVMNTYWQQNFTQGWNNLQARGQTSLRYMVPVLNMKL